MGCGCRGLELAGALAADGHAVRGTTRDPARAVRIEAAGAEPAVADPGRPATLLPQIEGVSAICWLMGTASGDRDSLAALHGSRLRSLLERLVDTPVRGFVYEAAGTVDRELLAEGTATAREAAETYRLRVEVVDVEPAETAGWTGAMTAALGRILGEARPA
ncbi:MAG TPA: NAD(P)H-binding protein [Thermoleophilaceae bacterium]|nr:NAD(P)H-binding protein [Thermoleophilaceae bacterium]